MQSSREDAGEDTSDDSINDHEDDDDDDDDAGGGGTSLRMLPLNPSSSSLPTHHRKSFPPPAKVFRPAPPTTWKAADEMIGVSVPRKARSASTKRSHECWASSGGIPAEQNHLQASTSPVRPMMTAAPASPSSSNASVRKKIKANGGPKFRPPKSSSKSSSSAQEEIEIEIAEVLYGMMRQPQGSSKQEIMANESREVNNKSSSDGRSRISSPISNSQSAPPQNLSSSPTPMSAVAPKRKRPRPVKPDDENPAIFSVRSSPISSITKAESDQPSKIENCSPNMDKNNPGSAPECLTNSQSEPPPPRPESIKPESNVSSDSKALAEESEKQKDVGLSKEVVPSHSPKKESLLLQVEDDREDVKATKASPTMSESENQREEKFQIDLMAPPPPLRSSPERDVEINLVVDAEKEVKAVVKEDDKPLRRSKEEVADVEMDKVRAKAEDAESQKPAIVQRERGIDLQLDLLKADKGDTAGNGTMVNKKQHQNLQRQQQQKHTEKNVQSNSVPLPMSVPSWPGGLPPMGYMAPLQGVVSMDGTTVTPAAIPPPHLLFNQPRPKRCATHCYIARNILYHQQIARMNPFWPAAAGSASLCGAKPGNLNVVPSTELHGNVPGRASNSTQDKGQSLTMFPGHIVKDKGSQPANVDNSSRKQILLQQALPPAAPPNNILHGPAFIFPLNQQQAAAAAASVRPGSVKSLPVTSNGTSSSTSNSTSLDASGIGATVAAAPTMSFSYPTLPGNETQYLAILQNNAYPFPIPAHVGGPAAYRGTHAQAFPFVNGSFYSSQMLHPSQIQQHQLPVQSQPSQQQGHQNTSISSGSSSSQKHAQNQQQKPNNAGGSNGGAAGGGSLQGFPVTKNAPSQPLGLQQQQQQQRRQQIQNHHTSHPARQVESEMGGEDSPSTADSRLTHATMNIYGQNFAMPMQTPNFALMTPASITGASSNGSHGEKKQLQRHPGPKDGGETSPAFAMSFNSINGASSATGLDLSSIAQNHSIMQSHNYQIMAAAHAASAQHKKNYLVPEEGKTVVNSSNTDEDKKGTSGKAHATIGQSIAFSRSDVSDPSITSLAGTNVIDSSGRSVNLGSASRTSSSVMPPSLSTNAASSQQHMQRNQPQILQLQKQHQFAAAVRNKTPSTSNGCVYSDSLPSTSSMAAKFPNAVSAFPQSLVQSSSAVAQSPQWKNSARPTTSQPPMSMASTPPSSVNKTLPQQQARSQQALTQISFAASPKSSTTQVQQPPSSTQSLATPVMVGSPTTSSMSKSTGSPRTTSTSTNHKISQSSSFSSQQPKNTPALPSRISSPVGARNVPSILSSPQLTPSSTTGTKSQLQQQQQKQQQVSKQNLPQAQLFFSNPYMPSQISETSSSTSTTSAASGYYLQRRGPEQMQRLGSSGSSLNGATMNSTKGSAFPTQGLLHPAQFAAMPPSGNHHQFVPAAFPYVHPVPSVVQVKPADQKQPAGE